MKEPALAFSVKLTPQGFSFWTQLLGTAPGPRSREKPSRYMLRSLAARLTCAHVPRADA